MKLVITGALGHIGSGFLHRIRPGEYDEVVLLDNLSTQRYGSLFHLPEGVRFRFFEEDILTADLARRFEGADAVAHLAAATDAATSFDRLELVERVNFEGTERVARACLAAGSRLVFLSTTSVYGTQAETVDEDCAEELLLPQSPYAASKLRAERLLRRLGEEEGLRYVICRFGTIFGPSPGMRFHTAVNKFLWQACLGLPITVWRTALDQHRPYLDVGDAAAALALILRKDLFRNEVYNVLTANETVSAIVGILRGHVPDLSVELVDARIMNQLSYRVSAERFAREGFAPEGSLERGIAETFRWLGELAGARALAAIPGREDTGSAKASGPNDAPGWGR